MENSVWSVAKP